MEKIRDTSSLKINASLIDHNECRLNITSRKTWLECRNGGHGKRRLRPATRDLGGHFAHPDRGNIHKKLLSCVIEKSESPYQQK